MYVLRARLFATTQPQRYAVNFATAHAPTVMQTVSDSVLTDVRQRISNRICADRECARTAVFPEVYCVPSDACNAYSCAGVFFRRCLLVWAVCELVRALGPALQVRGSCAVAPRPWRVSSGDRRRSRVRRSGIQRRRVGWTRWSTDSSLDGNTG